MYTWFHRDDPECEESQVRRGSVHGSLSVMRTFLFKPRRLPGFPPPKSSRKFSWRTTLLLFGIVAAFSFSYVGTLLLLDCIVTYFRIGIFQHLGLNDLPVWQAPVCMFSTLALLVGIVWWFRLLDRLFGFLERYGKHDA